MEIYNNTGTKIADIDLDDSSYRYRAVMGNNELTLKFALAEHLEIPVGAYCDFQGSRYTLMRPEALKMNHSRYFEYTVTMEGAEALAKIWKFRCVYTGEKANLTDGRLKFSLTAKPKEHLQMFIDNMNMRDSGWVIGDCIEGVEQLVSYDHAYCYEALSQMAEAFKTEFEIIGKTVSLHKIEYDKSNPLPLSYGKGNGFVSGVSRSNYGDKQPIEILYAQGGDRNIDFSKYHSKELLLPKGGTIQYDGEKFEDEEGFNASKARSYIASSDGYSVKRSDKPLSSYAEDSLDCSEVYPKRVGTVTEVVAVDAAKNLYDFIDITIPDTLNYEDYLIAGETMTVIFQSGMLAGRELDVKYIHTAKGGKKGKRFEIVSQEIDGETMPNDTFKPAVNDTYAIFGCMLPEAYINAYKQAGDKKEGAEWDMMRQCVKYLYDNEEAKFTFTGTLDGIWAKKDWVNIGGKIKLGGFIRFTDSRFQPEGLDIRIIGIKDYCNNPHSPEIELSNDTVTAGFTSQLKQIESQAVAAETRHTEAIQFTKRRFRDAKETMAMLQELINAGFDNFGEAITPITAQTMQLLVGDESLQFRFVNSRTNPQTVALNVTYNPDTKVFHVPAGILQHLTLGIKDLSSSHQTSEYHFWDISELNTPFLDEAEKKYWLYAKVEKNGTTGIFELLENPKKMEEEADYYYLLVGILNSEFEGNRSFSPLYGFSEVLPGRVTTERVVSGSGDSFFDLVANSFKLGSKLSFNLNGDGQLVLHGTMVQSGSGATEYIGCFRGVYNASSTYYRGDEITYTNALGLTSTYRYTSDSARSGINPTDTNYWEVVAQGSKGADGQNGQDGAPGKDGADGAPGKDGTNGKDGIDGVNGINGQDGAPGKDGADGAPGAKGDKGDKGDPGADGQDGKDGADGQDGKSPVMVFRGEYDSSKTYYGNENRLDCVFVDNNGVKTYYIAKIEADSTYRSLHGGSEGFVTTTATDTGYWNPFGGSFESVATNLLLANNANIGGWIFNGATQVLESSATIAAGNPKVYLDGTKGRINIRGALQQGTSCGLPIREEANLYYLPASTSSTPPTFSMSAFNTDLWSTMRGRVIKIFNAGQAGNSDYVIQYMPFRFTGSDYSANIDFTIGTTKSYYLHPQCSVELTCFERAYTDNNHYECEWAITGAEDTREGQQAKVLAQGTVTGAASGATIQYQTWDGGEMEVYRLGQGRYQVFYPFGNIGDNIIMATGVGYSADTTDKPIKATIVRQSSNTFFVDTSDDDSRNDGSFMFIVFSHSAWQGSSSSGSGSGSGGGGGGTTPSSKTQVTAALHDSASGAYITLSSAISSSATFECSCDSDHGDSSFTLTVPAGSTTSGYYAYNSLLVTQGNIDSITSGQEGNDYTITFSNSSVSLTLCSSSTGGGTSSGGGIGTQVEDKTWRCSNCGYEVVAAISPLTCKDCGETGTFEEVDDHE